MSKYITLFDTHTDYQTYINGQDKVLPNVSYCGDDNEVHYNPWVDPLRFVAKFNITSTSGTTSLFNNPTLLQEIEIDGVKYTGNDIYSHYNHQFDSTGMHTVKYTLVDGTTSIDGASFASKSDMISITIPNTITTIGSSAFGGCGSLTSVTIPNSVTTIIGSPFQGCLKLTSVTIPSSVTTISGSFCNCNFDDVIFESINPNATFVVDTTNKCIISDDGTVLLTGFNNTVAIPNTVTSIADYAFGWCYGLTSVAIPNTVTTIGESTFTCCNSLTSVTIPNSVTTIGESTFNSCSGLTSITIPDSVTSIGWAAFSGCSSLTSITIPDSVTSIVNGAFRGCSGLTSIVVNSGNSVYDSRDNCNAIIKFSTNELIIGCQNTVIPNSVTDIVQNAFYGCTGLTSVTIPNSVKSIGFSAFYNCSGLTSITSLSATAPKITYTSFQNVKTGGTLYVPTGSTGYNTWMGTGDFYLGKYNWTKIEQ